jgi:fumarate reductase subunit D
MTYTHQPRPGPARLPALLWALFANTALISALIVPAHILVQGVLAPLGLVPSFDRRYSTFAAALSNPLVKVYLLLLMAVCFYTFGHRIRYMLLDLGVHGKQFFGVLLYGLAAIGTVVAGYVIFTVP